MIKFLKNLFVFSLVLLGVDIFIYRFASSFYDSRFIYLLCFFIITTTAFHYIILSALQKKPQQFIRYYMALTGGRLFLYFVCLAIYLWFNRNHASIFFFYFFVLYACFSTFEIISLLKTWRNKTEN